MVTENEDYGPREAFEDFSTYVEEELGEEVPFRDEVDGACFFQNYEKFAVNAETHLQNQVDWLNYLDKRSEPLREAETDEYEGFIEDLDSAVDQHFETYNEVQEELYTDGEFDDEAVLSKSTPAQIVDGRIVSELELFVEDIYEASDSAREDVTELRNQYSTLADEQFETVDSQTYETDQNKPLKTEATEEDIERIESVTHQIESISSEIRENTQKM